MDAKIDDENGWLIPCYYHPRLAVLTDNDVTFHRNSLIVPIPRKKQ